MCELPPAPPQTHQLKLKSIRSRQTPHLVDANLKSIIRNQKKLVYLDLCPCMLTNKTVMLINKHLNAHLKCLRLQNCCNWATSANEQNAAGNANNNNNEPGGGGGGGGNNQQGGGEPDVNQFVFYDLDDDRDVEFYDENNGQHDAHNANNVNNINNINNNNNNVNMEPQEQNDLRYF